MITLTLKEVQPRGHALYCGRCRVGYVDSRTDKSYRWSLNFMSERLHHAPTGVRNTIEEALGAATEAFQQWCAAANLVEKNDVSINDDGSIGLGVRVCPDPSEPSQATLDLSPDDADRAGRGDKTRKRAPARRAGKGSAKSTNRTRKISR